eukprot:2789274-Pyramimonas_sp.AAC.1
MRGFIACVVVWMMQGRVNSAGAVVDVDPHSWGARLFAAGGRGFLDEPNRLDGLVMMSLYVSMVMRKGFDFINAQIFLDGENVGRATFLFQGPFVHLVEDGDAISLVEQPAVGSLYA